MYRKNLSLNDLLEACQVDHEAVFHIAFLHAVESGVDVLHVDQLDIRGDVVLGAEIQHFLGFLQAADQ